MSQEYTDRGASKKQINLLWTPIHRFLLMLNGLSDRGHQSRQSLENNKFDKDKRQQMSTLDNY